MRTVYGVVAVQRDRNSRKIRVRQMSLSFTLGPVSDAETTTPLKTLPRLHTIHTYIHSYMYRHSYIHTYIHTYMPCRAVPCRAVPCRAVPCRAVPCRAVSCRVVSCRVVSCRVVSCRVVSCRVVSCRVVSCRVVPRNPTTSKEMDWRALQQLNPIWNLHSNTKLNSLYCSLDLDYDNKQTTSRMLLENVSSYM